MKVVKITCDFCKEELNDKFIMIGSESEKELCFENTTKEDFGLRALNKYYNLHFCCMDHFVRYFFEKGEF